MLDKHKSPFPSNRVLTHYNRFSLFPFNQFNNNNKINSNSCNNNSNNKRRKLIRREETAKHLKIKQKCPTSSCSLMKTDNSANSLMASTWNSSKSIPTSLASWKTQMKWSMKTCTARKRTAGKKSQRKSSKRFPKSKDAIFSSNPWTSSATRSTTTTTSSSAQWISEQSRYTSEYILFFVFFPSLGSYNQLNSFSIRISWTRTYMATAKSSSKILNCKHHPFLQSLYSSTSNPRTVRLDWKLILLIVNPRVFYNCILYNGTESEVGRVSMSVK